MSSTDQNKPTGKSGLRKGKAEQRTQKQNRQQSLKADQPESVKPDQLKISEPDQSLSAELDQQQNREPGQLLDTQSDRQSSEKPGQQQNVEPDRHQNPKPEPHVAEERISATLTPAEIIATATGAAAATEGVRVNFQSIANAYGDYTRKSLEQTRTFFEKLTGVRSVDKIIEVQAEFAKQSFETFVAGSQRICELQQELARQAFKPLQRLMDNRSRGQR
jgi:hypothetical protein